MSLNIPYVVSSTLLISQSHIVTVLSIVVIFFSVLLVLGVRKSYLLKKENDKLSEIDTRQQEEQTPYKDFRESHMYDNN